VKSLLVAALLAAAGGAAAEAPPAPEPGAAGTLLTTVAGSRPTEIPVRYVGKLQQVFPGHDLHIIELEGEEGKRIGAANGMSGSPVYFDGRLIGALSYRLGALPKSPIAGVTPIEEMYDASRIGPRPAIGDDAALRPIATPVLLGGLAPSLREWLAPQIEQLGLVPASGSGGGGQGDPGEIVPGGAIGVKLVDGDVRISATGTVTDIDDDVVYAFGHPFVGVGRVEMPMAPADVVHILSDFSGGFHMVNVGEAVGAIVEDRQTAIVGRMGEVARMIPFEIAVRGADYGEQTIRFSVVANSEMTPMLGAVATANALFQSNGYTQKTTVLAHGSLKLREHGELPLEMAFSSSQGIDPGIGVAGTMLGILQGLWVNPFRPLDLEAVEMTLELHPEPRSYRIESLRYDRGSLRPGELLKVECDLRGYRGATSTHELEIRLPEKLPREGTLTLAVSSPAGIDQVLGSPLSRRLASARNLEAVLDALEQQRSAHRLTAVVYEPRGSVVSRGFVYSDLPPTASRLLSLGGSAADRRARPLRRPLGRSELELDGPIENGLQLRLKIRRGVVVGEEQEKH
jgi:hypothetical protein